MITLELSSIDVGFAKTEGGISLAFVDQQSGIRCLVPFDERGWENFKRHVVADGNLPAVIVPIIHAPDEKNGRGAA